MSVIIRLQNLPWSANALDIRQFFRGLSIPEGGVHIVGGEMGDAFIAFSTDEDARQAMMHDREAINGVQIRLLLSSRAEMQKVIEVARQQSLLALKKASATVTQPKVSTPIVANVQKTLPTTAPQPPIISASSFQNILGTTTTAGATPSFLAYQQQAGLTLIPDTNKSSSKNNDSDDSESRHSRERRRSVSRDRRRSRSRSRERSVYRRRREHSRDKSRERDRSNGKRSSRHRSRSRERNRSSSRERSRDRSRERREHSRYKNVDKSRDDNRTQNMDKDNKSNPNIAHWNAANAYQTNYKTTEFGLNMFNRTMNYGGNFNNSTTTDMTKTLENCNKSIEPVSSALTRGSVTSASDTFQNYKTANQSQIAVNNYSLSSLLGAGNSNDSLKPFALQNPYTTALSAKPQDTTSNTTSSSAIPGIFVEKKPDDNLQTTAIDITNSLPQEPIAFANVNPYEQMYPNLFAQAAALSSGQKLIGTKQSSMTTPTNSPKMEDNKPKDVDPSETNCVKISNMCSRTTYSDLRKFFGGLFIPHNGIKMLNDKNGVRVGIAYVQFSRQSSVAKALCRSNNIFKGKSVIIETVSEQEFNDAEDSFRPPNQDKAYSHRSNDSDNENNDSGTHGSNNSSYSALNPYKKVIHLEPFTVLYIEDIPALATEQDIMKMFSSYSLYDILLIASPENRREFVAYVRFSREEDAKSAYEDRAHHQIGYRRLRVRPGTIEEMENAKEKIRLANEQLMKEEQAAEEEETKRKLEKLITDHITQEENKMQQQEQEQHNVVSMDLTQEDGDGEENEITETTNEPESNNTLSCYSLNSEGAKYHTLENRNNDMYDLQNKHNNFTMNVDPRRPQASQMNNIPSLFDVDPMSNSNIMRNPSRPNLFNDPRLRNMSEKEAATIRSIDNNKMNQEISNNNINNFPNNLMNQSSINPPTNMMNNTENNFVILKNCDYGTRINDVAQLLLTANLGLKHIEPLHNERHLPTGEFIVEFRRPNDAEIAVQRFHNIQFRNRSLRVFPITPQEIADRLDKPFLGYLPGGNGIRMNKGLVGDNNMQRNNFNAPSNNNNNNSNNNRFNNASPPNMKFNNFRGNNPFNDNNSSSSNRNNNGGNSGIPDKFTRPGCVLSLENVPYKAQLSDILRFFQGFDLTPDDIIRRYNDDGTPTGDARVAFMSSEEARAAYESKKRKQIFGRNVYINII